MIDWDCYKGLFGQYSNLDVWDISDKPITATRWTQNDVASRHAIFVEGLQVVIVVQLVECSATGELVFSVEDAFAFDCEEGKAYRSERYAPDDYSAGIHVDPRQPITRQQYRTLGYSITDFEFQNTLEIHSIVQDWALLGAEVIPKAA